MTRVVKGEGQFHVRTLFGMDKTNYQDATAVQGAETAEPELRRTIMRMLGMLPEIESLPSGWRVTVTLGHGETETGAWAVALNQIRHAIGGSKLRV